MKGPVVVCGARGFVGSHLVRQLVARGVPVRATTRHPSTAPSLPRGAEWVEMDVEQPETVRRAFDGAEAVVYLVHHMRSDDADLREQEAIGATNVREAAEANGVRRIVYLGAPAPPEGGMSHHLEARLNTGDILRGGSVSCIELRSSMIIGVESESWMICRDLAMRLPVMVLPSWLNSRSEPIGIADVVRALVGALEMPRTDSAWFNMPGPEALSARDILLRIAAVRGGRPVMIDVPFLSPGMSSHWIRLVTRADYRIARYLVDGLTSDLVCGGDRSLWEALDDEPTPLDQVIADTLAAEPPLSPPGRALERVARALQRSR